MFRGIVTSSTICVGSKNSTSDHKDVSATIQQEYSAPEHSRLLLQWNAAQFVPNRNHDVGQA